MMKTFDAVVTNGLLKPAEPVDLPENQRLRVTVEEVASQRNGDRAARERLVEFLRRYPLHIRGPLPTREELYDNRV